MSASQKKEKTGGDKDCMPSETKLDWRFKNAKQCEIKGYAIVLNKREGRSIMVVEIERIGVKRGGLNNDTGAYNLDGFLLIKYLTLSITTNTYYIPSKLLKTASL